MKNPKIRFKGCTEDWEQRKLGEVTERVQGNDGRMDLPTLTISAANGWLDQRDRFSSNIAGSEQKNYTLLHKGELSYNHGNSKLAKYGTVFALRTYEEALVPRVYHSFKVNEEASADFIEYAFATKLPDRELGKLISSGARMDGLLNINYDEFMSINMMLPSIEEQIRISEHLRKIDTLITLHQRKCEETKKLKKYMLQKMFPKDGATVPEIRFAGFTEAWEQRKVSDVAEIIAGGTPSTKENSYWEPKEIPWLSSGEVHKKYITFTDDMISQIGMNNSSAKMVAKDSVLIALAGQGKTRGTVAINRIPLTTNQSIAAMTFNEDFIPEFVFYNLENRYDEIRRMSSGDGSRGGLNKQLVGDIEIPYTEKEEQERIGSFFEALDHLITLHQRKSDELQNIKKYMLQNMFV